VSPFLQVALLDWPYAGLVLAAVLSGLLLREAARLPPRVRDDPAWVLGWIWPMYLLHQFEEHGIDLLGRRYAFLGFLCESLGRPDGGCPATPAFIFSVNVLACQLAFGLAFALRRRAPLVAACVWGIPMVNVVPHVLAAVATGRYNPGLFTAVVLFVPACTWMLRTVVRSGVVPPAGVWRIVATGVLTHAVLIGSLRLRERGLISAGVLFLLNALNGGWALPLGRSGARPGVADPLA
jgi:Protein of unknown function with HXXEE motif